MLPRSLDSPALVSGVTIPSAELRELNRGTRDDQKETELDYTANFNSCPFPPMTLSMLDLSLYFFFFPCDIATRRLGLDRRSFVQRNVKISFDNNT